MIPGLGGLGFAAPWWLAMLAVLPVAAWWCGRARAVPSVPVPAISRFRALGRPVRRHPGRARWWLVLAALGLLIVAIARPRVPLGEVPDPSKGIDIMLALDFSSSMTLRDFHIENRRVSRREALTHVVEDFIVRRPNDRIGIVGFAKSPFLVSPLTLDHAWTLEALRQAATSTGTGIGEGLVAAVHFLLKASQRSKVVILVTDGENDLGRRPLEVLGYPQQAGVRVYAILIGPDVIRGTALVNHELFKVSRATGGQFFQATDTRSLEGVYAMIDQLEKKALREKRLLQYRELFPWLAAAALGVLLADAGSRVLRRRIP
jgi:Ca-activated chloride channel family protein